MLTREIRQLIRKELMLEWKQKYAFNGLLMYVISTVFICYLSFRQIVDPPTWNALFWIILLFAAVNGSAKSFLQESRGRQLYLYTLASPQAVILSKVFYNQGLMLLLGLINLLFYSVFVGNPVQDLPLFLLALLLGSVGFASALTMISAIASRAGHNTTLMAILGFPVLIPLLITTIRFSKNAMDGIAWTATSHYVVILLGLNVLILALSFLLFPYLWRD
jgi:heme exporter protein B